MRSFRDAHRFSPDSTDQLVRSMLPHMPPGASETRVSPVKPYKAFMATLDLCQPAGQVYGPAMPNWARTSLPLNSTVTVPPSRTMLVMTHVARGVRCQAVLSIAT